MIILSNEHIFQNSQIITLKGRKVEAEVRGKKNHKTKKEILLLCPGCS